MTDYVKDFVDVKPAVGDDTYALYYPYDGTLDLGFDTPGDAWDWYVQVPGAEPVHENAVGAYVVRVRIEKVEGF